jgi:hypothetical protein
MYNGTLVAIAHQQFIWIWQMISLKKIIPCLQFASLLIYGPFDKISHKQKMV